MERRDRLYEMEGDLSLLEAFYREVLEHWLRAQESMIRGYLLDAHKMIMLALDTLDRIAGMRADIQAKLSRDGVDVNIAMLEGSDEKIKSGIILQLVALTSRNEYGAAESEYVKAGKLLLDAVYEAVSRLEAAKEAVHRLAEEAGEGGGEED